MHATIEVTGLRKRFGPTLALDGMSFTVQPGHVTGFVGPNGAGKSTTMRVILGLDAPDEGPGAGGRPAVREPAAPDAGDRLAPGRRRAAAQPQCAVTTCSGWPTRRAWPPGGLTR